jgi:hypothetical protein
MANSDDPIPYRPGMTLMPGQSTTVSVPISPEIAEQIGGNSVRMVQVPPPAKAPWHEIGETLGLCEGLRPERSDHQFRCAACHKMQPSGSWMVWVPDIVRRKDPDWSVTEAARLNAYNGHLSGWCISCAPKTPESKKPPENRAPNKAAAGFLTRMICWWNNREPRSR